MYYQMVIQKIKDLLKDHNHILIDYTDKFINDKSMIENLKIFLKMDEKTRLNIYENVVFLIDGPKLKKYHFDFFNLLRVNGHVFDTNVLLLKNCGHSFMYDKYSINNSVVHFINIKREIHNCNI